MIVYSGLKATTKLSVARVTISFEETAETTQSLAETATKTSAEVQEEQLQHDFETTTIVSKSRAILVRQSRPALA